MRTNTNKQIADVPDSRTDKFSLTVGCITISWPGEIHESDLNDIQDWVDLVMRKISRSANKPCSLVFPKVADTPDTDPAD